jgi:hypothetical protein
MNAYFVECYWPGVDEQRFDLAAELLGTHESGGVRWTSSILIPIDEIVLYLAAGSSAEAVRAAAERAGLGAERVVPCLELRRKAQDLEQGDQKCNSD